MMLRSLCLSVCVSDFHFPPLSLSFPLCLTQMLTHTYTHTLSHNTASFFCYQPHAKPISPGMCARVGYSYLHARICVYRQQSARHQEVRAKGWIQVKYSEKDRTAALSKTLSEHPLPHAQPVLGFKTPQNPPSHGRLLECVGLESPQ